MRRIQPFLSETAFPCWDSLCRDNPSSWRLKRFFQELFDYCFPANFRSEQRKKFNQARQKDRRVWDFVQELNRREALIGGIGERVQPRKAENERAKLWPRNLSVEIIIRSISSPRTLLRLKKGISLFARQISLRTHLEINKYLNYDYSADNEGFICRSNIMPVRKS